ncbi:hypothetical protein CPB83DRAFT_926356 [Crepidotus variabilis]|uniref:Uncharacterized protein n=1 Tax=Crepidotus variabilis TaxID=179855 RepID=A0A9P6EIM0_9AGAR|nr:hypothetical protein CPB83DRAFT_926356 [Crepidotus variabilis]
MNNFDSTETSQSESVQAVGINTPRQQRSLPERRPNYGAAYLVQDPENELSEEGVKLDSYIYGNDNNRDEQVNFFLCEEPEKISEDSKVVSSPGMESSAISKDGDGRLPTFFLSMEGTRLLKYPPQVANVLVVPQPDAGVDKPDNNGLKTPKAPHLALRKLEPKDEDDSFMRLEIWRDRGEQYGM